MANKFQLDPKPTFSAPVNIPLHGGGSTDVKFTFKHKNAKDLDIFITGTAETSKLDATMEMCSGWELTDEWNELNVEKLLNNYIGAFGAIVAVYLDELRQFKIKN